jgi:hypothetical protein
MTLNRHWYLFSVGYWPEGSAEDDERDSYSRTNSVMATSTAFISCGTSSAGRDSSFAKRSKLSGSSELCEVRKASRFTSSAFAQTLNPFFERFIRLSLFSAETTHNPLRIL